MHRRRPSPSNNETRHAAVGWHRGDQLPLLDSALVHPTPHTQGKPLPPRQRDKHNSSYLLTHTHTYMQHSVRLSRWSMSCQNNRAPYPSQPGREGRTTGRIDLSCCFGSYGGTSVAVPQQADTYLPIDGRKDLRSRHKAGAGLRKRPS